MTHDRCQKLPTLGRVHGATRQPFNAMVQRRQEAQRSNQACASLCGLCNLRAFALERRGRCLARIASVDCSGTVRTRRHRRKGLLLILVLIVIAMLSLGAYAFTNLMLAHHEAAVVTGRQAQARALVDSGVTAVQLFLAQPEADQLDAGGLFDNVGSFGGVVVLEDDDPLARGSFSVVSPNMDSEGNLSGVRHGLEDESTRLNLNVLLILDKQVAGSGRTLLMGLPGMTEDVADAILDWLDPDDEPREFGAEIETYSGMSPPYGTKNGAVDTVEELLLVRGVTPQLLFGADINRNGQLDQHEMLEDITGGASTDPTAFRGWSAYLTLYSVESNANPEGQPKAYLNTSDLNQLVEDLEAASFPEEWITFIVAYRQAGPTAAATATRGTVITAGIVPTGNQTGELNMDLPAKTPIGGVLDLIGAQVEYTFQGAQAPSTLTSPFTETGLASFLSQLMDYVTVNPAATIPGRINVNQCSRTVLMGIPGMTAELADKILAQRSADATNADSARRYETWLFEEGVVTLAEMKVLMPFICGSGRAFRAQVVGYFQGGQSSSRAEVVFEATSPLPRVVLWRDLSHLGRGYTLESLGLNNSP
jgi:Type II secretion system (T2SS), protein K